MAAYRAAINGYGRIGQSLLRAALERTDLNFNFVAINELAELETIAYLTRYDSTHGRLSRKVESRGSNCLLIDGQPLAVYSEPDISNVDWSSDNIDIVFDCTGVYSSSVQLHSHISSGARKVLLSQPGDGSLDKTVVYGVNHEELSLHDQTVSAASCTSNAVVPVLKVIDEIFGINSGSLTTIHSAMNDQPVIDAYHHSDLRRTRSAMQNIVPVDTSLVKGIERLLPGLDGKLSATAIRVPTVNVSAMEVCLFLRKDVRKETVNDVLSQAASSEKYNIISYTEEPLASSDFLQDAHSCNIDGSQTKVSGNRFVKILIWFDNEWAYANRMLDIACYWFSKQSK